MRKITAATFVSLDGVMQAPGGPAEDPTGGFSLGGWTVPFWEDDDVLGNAMGELFSTPYDLLLGRRTYDIFAAHWPHLKDDPIADAFNRVTKYVATHEPGTLAWQNSEWLGDDVVARLTALKQTDGPTLLIQGSSELIQTLLAAGLIDEFRLLVFPVMLGRGKKLFGGGTGPQALKLAGSQVSRNGVMLVTYLPDGAVGTGSFQLDPPAEAEVERRQGLRT